MKKEFTCGKYYKAFKKNNTNEVTLTRIMCNNRLECMVCAKAYSNELYSEYSEIINLMMDNYGIGDFITGELTISKNISSRLKNKKENFILFNKAGASVMKHCFGKTASLKVFHNWGKKSPMDQHWHFHFLILPWDINGVIQETKMDNTDILDIWRIELLSHDLIRKSEYNQVKYINKKILSKDSPSIRTDIDNRINYLCQQPILSIDKSQLLYDEYQEFLSVVKSIPKHFKRYIWHGWMSNAYKQRNLNNLGIKQIEEEDFLSTHTLISTKILPELNDKDERIFVPQSVIKEGMKLLPSAEDVKSFLDYNCNISNRKSENKYRFCQN